MIRRSVNSISFRAYCSASNLSNDIQNAKPFSDMPTIRFLKIIVDCLPGGKYYKKPLNQCSQLLKEEYGNIVRIPGMLRRPQFVITFNPDDFEKVYRVEGNWPVRYGIDSLKYYRLEKRPEIYKDLGSLFLSHGEKWSEIRTIANPILIQPKTIKRYLTQIDDIAKEFVELMRKIRNEKSEMPGDFSAYINTWSIESVTAVILERRLNQFDSNTKDENAKKLIKGVQDFFEQSVEYDGKPSIWKYYQTKGFKELMNVYDNITDVIMYYIELAMKEMNEENSSSNDTEDSVLRKLLRADKRVAIIVVSDLLLAGVNTTASATLNTLYCLAKNPDKQEILRQELLKILPEKNSQLTPEKAKIMPYLRAVIKESFRTLPIVQGHLRMTTKDVVLSGYHVPVNTHVGMQPLFALQDEKFYPNPQKFLPERWLREQTEGCPRAGVSSPFTFLPFGFGARSCIGKRIAELELETIVANIIRNFKVEWHYPDMKIDSTFVNTPDSEMRFKIIDI